MVEHSLHSSLMHSLIPVFCLATNVLIQVLSFRYIRGMSLLKSIVLGFVLGFATLFAMHGARYRDTPGLSVVEFFDVFIVDFITYSSLGYCYFHFLNLGETARRIRILRELYDAKDGLTMDEILRKYNSRNMVELRLGRLIGSGQVSITNNRYHIKSTFLLMTAKLITLMKLVILGKRSEFD